jgi:hypothetical protein
MIQHQPPSTRKLALLLLTIQLLPSLLLYFDLDTSMALGTALAALLIILVFTFSRAVDSRCYAMSFGRLMLAPFAISAACVLWIIPHAALADHFLPIDFLRLLKTLPLLFLLLSSSIAFGEMLFDSDNERLDRALRVSFWVLCLAVLFRIVGLQPATAGNFPKSTFPFTETSHFALAFAPIFLYRCAMAAKSRRLWWLVSGFVVALGLQSVTLLFGCLLAAFICRRLLLVSLFGTVFVLAAVPFGLEYFTARLDLSDSASNLSSLVYIQGWQMLKESLANSIGWGVGFEQMGVHGTLVSASDALISLSGAPTNILDGSFVFAKLGSELGLFGISLTMVFLIATIRSLRALRNSRERAAITFARCVLVAFTVDMFLRGTAYFASSTLLATACACVLFLNGMPHFSRNKKSTQAIPA